jgi:ketosteroid isomerase-like protein
MEGTGTGTAEGVGTVTALIEAEGRRDIDAMLALLAEDVVLDMPFAPGGGALLHGREAVGDALRAAIEPGAGLYELWRMWPLEVHGTSTPGLCFAVFAASARTWDGRAYDQTYIGRFEVRDGLVAVWREWFDPLPLLAVTG